MTVGKKGGRPTKAQAAAKLSEKEPAVLPTDNKPTAPSESVPLEQGGGVPLPPFPEQAPKNKGGRPSKEMLASREAQERLKASEDAASRLEPCKQEARMFSDLTFSLVAMWRGPVWKLAEAETEALANAIGPVLAKYPQAGGEYRVEITAAVALAVIVMGKLGQEAALRGNTRQPQPVDTGPVAPVSPVGSGSVGVRENDAHSETVAESTPSFDLRPPGGI